MEKLRRKLPMPSTFPLWNQQGRMKTSVSFESEYNYEFTSHLSYCMELVLRRGLWTWFSSFLYLFEFTTGSLNWEFAVNY